MVRNIVVQVGHHHRHDHDRSDDGKYPHRRAHPGREQQRNPKRLALMSLRYAELWNNFWKMLQGTARPPHP